MARLLHAVAASPPRPLRAVCRSCPASVEYGPADANPPALERLLGDTAIYDSRDFCSSPARDYDLEPQHLHHVVLTGLRPGEPYIYRVSCGEREAGAQGGGGSSLRGRRWQWMKVCGANAALPACLRRVLVGRQEAPGGRRRVQPAARHAAARLPYGCRWHAAGQGQVQPPALSCPAAVWLRVGGTGRGCTVSCTRQDRAQAQLHVPGVRRHGRVGALCRQVPGVGGLKACFWFVSQVTIQVSWECGLAAPMLGAGVGVRWNAVERSGVVQAMLFSLGLQQDGGQPAAWRQDAKIAALPCGHCSGTGCIVPARLLSQSALPQ